MSRFNTQWAGHDGPEPPPVRPSPCGDCPWLRRSIRGWLGPLSAAEWINLVQSDHPIACHQTLQEQSWYGAEQCAGAARFRANILKEPRDPDVARGPADNRVLGSVEEFLGHHKSSLADYLEAERVRLDRSIVERMQAEKNL